MLPETVVCFRWAPPRGYRSTFGPETVNTLRRMVQRHFPHPHRFVCLTDDPTGLDPEVEAIEIWRDFADVASPHGGKNPSCYRRLRLFAPETAAVLGRRYVSLDLDCVVVDDLTPLWDRPDDLVLWGDYVNPTTPYNGSMMLMSAGARAQVWTTFDPDTSPRQSLAAKCWGSDQGWISHVLGPREARWTTKDGVYSYRMHIARRGNRLPANARIVFMHGRYDPWEYPLQYLPWVKDHWC